MHGDARCSTIALRDQHRRTKACVELGVTEVGSWAHARSKFYELWANHGSTVSEHALTIFSALYDVEGDIADLAVSERREIRHQRARPATDALRQRPMQPRQKVPDGSATAKAIDYTPKRWRALELAVCRQLPGRPAGRRRDEPTALGADQ